MKEIDTLIEVIDRLLSPGGCPWDREQTMKSFRNHVLEEVCELIEAIDLEDNQHIREELGDLFFNAIFLCRLAEKEERCSLDEVVQEAAEKLMRRHPHVFGEAKVESSTAVRQQWDEIKKREKEKALRKSALDGIPKGLPALARAYKILQKMKKVDYTSPPLNSISEDFNTEEELGQFLFKIVATAQEKQLDPEHALRSVLAQQEQVFRQNEDPGLF